MPDRWIPSIPLHRWLIAAAVIVLAIIYGELCMRQRQGPVDLGVQTTHVGGQVVVSRVQPAGLAWAAGIRPGDHVVTNAGNDQQLAQAAATSSLTVVTVAGKRLTVSTVLPALSETRYRWITFLSIATLFVVVGSGVFVLSASGEGSPLLLGMSTAAALALLSAIATPTGAAWALVGVNIGLISFATLTFLLFLALAFPQAHSLTRQRVYGFCASIAAILFTGYAASVCGDGRWYDIMRPWLFGIVCSYLLAACGLALLVLTRPIQRRGDRVALKLAVLGVCGSVVPFCVVVLIPGIIGLRVPIAPDLAAGTLAALPISLGFAVLTQQWFGIEQLARRSVVALAVWSALLLGYSLALDGLWLLGQSHSGLLAAVVHTATFQVAFIAGSFPLVQHTLRRWLERQIFQVGELPAVQLQRLQSALAQARDVEVLATTALAEIGSVLRPTQARLVLLARQESPTVYWWPAKQPNGRTAKDQRSDRLRRWRRFVLRAQGQPVGIIGIGNRERGSEWSPEVVAFVAGLLPLLAVTLHNALLLEHLQHQVGLLSDREQALARLSSQLLQTQEEERRRLAFDLHDDSLQRTILLERALSEGPKTTQTVRWRWAVAEIAASLRAICASLRPPMLDDLGLLPALTWLVNDIRARSDLEVDLLFDPHLDDHPIDDDLAVALYRITQEALNNCRKHAHATQVTVELMYAESQIQLRVADNGRGYRRTEQRPGHHGMGFAGMHERLRPLGGHLFIGKTPTGGMVLTVMVPQQEKCDDDRAFCGAVENCHRR